MKAVDQDRESDNDDCDDDAEELQDHFASTLRKSKPSITTQKDTRHLFVFSSEKSGMENDSGLSKNDQMRIIYDASKGSKYMSAAESSDAKNDEKIARIMKKVSTATPNNLRTCKNQAMKLIEQLEQHRSFERHVCVLDMDSFYASVELRDRPELKEKPIAVGEGMICTSNYVARKWCKIRNAHLVARNTTA